MLCKDGLHVKMLHMHSGLPVQQFGNAHGLFCWHGKDGSSNILTRAL